MVFYLGPINFLIGYLSFMSKIKSIHDYVIQIKLLLDLILILKIIIDVIF